MNDQADQLGWVEFRDRSKQGRDQTDSSGCRPGAEEPPGVEVGDPDPVGHGAADRHAEGSRAAHRQGGDIATNRRDEQELSVLCLRVLQSALVYVNTLMVQDVLADKAWADQMTEVDHRGLTPLFWTHIAPYGEIRLNMQHRLSLMTS
ncbi:Tn3 family transposase [Labedaea rhizosphaerae]|uniref:Tn3 family transposase n=1 Tax=Labedaea rhizosphaerae TaxID=598644 RepID=UPI00141505D2|nr:Tn3 family transposase [Labedaea rhizosphaerae]